MLWPFSAVSHVVETPSIKLYCCYFAIISVMSLNVNIWYDESLIYDPLPVSCGPQVAIRCYRCIFSVKVPSSTPQLFYRPSQHQYSSIPASKPGVGLERRSVSCITSHLKGSEFLWIRNLDIASLCVQLWGLLQVVLWVTSKSYDLISRLDWE